MGRFILNSRDEVAGKFYIQPVAERKYTRLRCAKVSLPNTITTAHPEEDMRFTTKEGANTHNYIISLQDINSSDGNFWATRINERLRQQGINDWFWRYDDNVGKFSVEFPTNGTDSITFTKECRIFGITKGEVITHFSYKSGTLQFTQQIGQSFPSVNQFVVEVTDANENQKYLRAVNTSSLGKTTPKETAAGIQAFLNSNITAIYPQGTSPAGDWIVSWVVTAGAGDAVTYTMSWATPPAGVPLGDDFYVRYYYTNNNGYPEVDETGVGSLFTIKNTADSPPNRNLVKSGTVAYSYANAPTINTDYNKTLTIPATEHTQANMVTLINGLAIDGLTASATGANQYTLTYVPRTTATLTQFVTGTLSIYSSESVAGFGSGQVYELTTASPTLVLTLPTNPERTDTFIQNVVNLVPYNHAYVTCDIVTQECHASVGNEAVICEVPHAGAFMERHHYESNSNYYLPISRQDAVSGIQIGIIDDLGRDLKSRLRGATYLVVLEME
jgi:flagellar biosynthesis protein FliQ